MVSSTDRRTTTVIFHTTVLQYARSTKWHSRLWEPRLLSADSVQKWRPWNCSFPGQRLPWRRGGHCRLGNLHTSRHEFPVSNVALFAQMQLTLSRANVNRSTNFSVSKSKFCNVDTSLSITIAIISNENFSRKCLPKIKRRARSYGRRFC